LSFEVWIFHNGQPDLDVDFRKSYSQAWFVADMKYQKDYYLNYIKLT